MSVELSVGVGSAALAVGLILFAVWWFSRATKTRGKSVKRAMAKSAGQPALAFETKPGRVPYKYYHWMNLTEREKEIALLASQGKSNEAIAEQLSITVGTVKWHIHNLLEKLEIQSRQELRYIVPPIVEYDRDTPT